MERSKNVEDMQDHKERATDVVFSPVDLCLTTASADPTAELWRTDGALIQTFRRFCNKINGIAFQRDGELAASSARDSPVRVWDLRTCRNIQGRLKFCSHGPLPQGKNGHLPNLIVKLLCSICFVSRHGSESLLDVTDVLVPT
ncbi:unnamed protein product [Arabis nemorensis]|uniref:Uncharacterized protein n=1 Tax=Arabis nemorensis TaxID=586526 RepID=A0A565CLC2_9BRAS|nr:unnamed protein product [Arabis nemorensis]